MNAGQYLLRWSVGFAVATLLAWALSGPFLESVVPWQTDPVVKTAVPAPGHVHQGRKEGWGTTRFGRFGVAGIPDIRELDGPSVAIWGDSYVEAFQVDDADKMAQQVTQICPSRAGRPITGVGIGRSGRDVADTAFLIERYEALFEPEAHFIFIGALNDLVPDPGQALEERSFPISWGGVRPVVERFELEFLWRAVRTVLGSTSRGRTIRLRPGPVPPARAPSDGKREVVFPEADALGRLIDAVTSKTSKPVIFVYAPRAPQIRTGRIHLADPNAAFAEQLSQFLARRGIPFINLGDRFTQYWQHTGRFPRGFANGRPSRGHLNPAGHRLVADAICDHLATR